MKKESATFALAVTMVLNLSLPPLLAQAAPSAKLHTKSTAPMTRVQHAHEKPCWEVAGISKSAMAERRRIEQETHSQVQSVCNDSSLNEQKKREKIREVRQQSHQQIEALINPQQQEAMTACQKERAAARAPATVQGESVTVEDLAARLVPAQSRRQNPSDHELRSARPTSTEKPGSVARRTSQQKVAWLQREQRPSHLLPA
ncbi:MAG: hypothetical protein DMG88_10130 [Acidobacteria bacterium]|nr:MAG: hypothetical protein DMG88_10130 [Acidobacteriota bacterium]